MSTRSIRGWLAALTISLLVHEASARIPPPPVPLDVLLKKADRIVVGRVEPGSLKSMAKDKEIYNELTLLVTRSLDGKDVGKRVTVTRGSFPAREFPPSKEHPQGRFLLTGWNEEGFRSESRAGLDLHAEQVWFLERLRPDRVRDLQAAPHGVDCFESVHKLEHAGLIELLARQAPVAKLRKHIRQEYKGKIPVLAVQGLYGSGDDNAGALVWEHIEQYEALAKRHADLVKKEGRLNRSEEQAQLRLELEAYSAPYAFRSLNSLGRHEALKWVRKSLDPREELYWGSLETLKLYQDAESVPVLLERLKHARDDERSRLIATLGEIGDRRAIPALIELLPEDSPHQTVRLALFHLTDIRFSLNSDYARQWWKRNHDKPRWHWLKQGIEQDLHLLANKPPVAWERDLDPYVHLCRSTCWRFPHGPQMAADWAKWWQANRDLPQDRWILDSFKAVGHPLPDLGSNEAVDALVKAYNTKPEYWWDKGPTLDPYLHHYWCQRLLTRITGWDIEDTHYFHTSRSDWYDYQKYGPLWEKEWKRGQGFKLNAIEVPAKQPFTMAEEDLKLLCEDFASWQVDLVFKGPLVRKKLPQFAGIHIVATFEIMLTNRSKRDLTLFTKPYLVVEAGIHEGSGSRWGRRASQSNTHEGEFATLKPGESIRWLESDTLASWEKDRCWAHFELHFEERGKREPAWRGRLSTPWISIKKENVRDES